MLDLDFIYKNKEKVREAISLKSINLNLDEFLALDEKRRTTISEVDELRRKQNEFNSKVQCLKGAEKEKELEGMKSLSLDLKGLEENLREVEKKWRELYLSVPNIPSEDTPVGAEEANREIEKVGEPPKFDFKLKSHEELGRDLDLVDFERGVKTSGFRGYYLKNQAVMLHWGLIFYALRKMQEKGFTLMSTPTIIKEFALVGSGHFPFGREDIYELANTGKNEEGKVISENFYLAGTSEPALLAYFSDTTLDEEDLPKKVCGVSSCYRNEVGSYGKDTKGLYRIHEFMKVEQVVLCKADLRESNKYLEEMREISQEILNDLKLPFRVVQISTGDMGAGKYKMYDIETWMPSREGYGETHSDSNLTDWQSRRLNIKYKTKDGAKKFAYALNNTVIASPRILIAILENCQNADGSITVPEVLRPFCGFDKIKKAGHGEK